MLKIITEAIELRRGGIAAYARVFASGGVLEFRLPGGKYSQIDPLIPA